MKKAIFLVEDIVFNREIYASGKKFAKRPVTLLEKFWSIHLSHDRSLESMAYITNVIDSGDSDYIEFQPVNTFINDVDNSNQLPPDRNVYYFISSWLEIGNFHLTNLLLIDQHVRKFLVKHDIPIIIDSTMETGSVYQDVYNIFQDKYYLLQERSAWNDILKLKFYTVFGGIRKNTNNYQFDMNVNVRYFPCSFFHTHYKNSEGYHSTHNYFDKNPGPDPFNMTWGALCRKPSITRVMFQINAELSKLTKFGRYSRIYPCQDFYRTHYSRYELNKLGYEKGYYKFLDQLVYLDDYEKVKEYYYDENIVNDMYIDYQRFTKNFKPMIQVVIETCLINCYKEFFESPTQLSEKSVLPIISKRPFIPIGGYLLGKILKKIGFVDYRTFEFSNNKFFPDDLDYVKNNLVKLNMLTESEKNSLYAEWQETAEYNYNYFFNLDIKKLYLEFLNIDMKDWFKHE